MKYPKLSPSQPLVFKRGSHGLGLSICALAVTLASPQASAAVVDLGTAGNFAVLAGSGITIAGPVNSTFITGDIGSFPTDSITGTENLVLNGTNHQGNAATQAAKNDLTTAYLDAASRPADVTYGAGHSLSGTLISGVYQSSTSFSIDGVLTLDAQGDSNAIWIFQAGSTLITASDSIVELIGGAQAANVFWQVGSSATLGTDSQFLGTILALQSITLNTGATIIDGRALARDGAVTMDQNVIMIPEPGAALLLASGLLFGLLRRSRAIG